MAARPLNLLGEIGLLTSLVSWPSLLMFILCFFSAAYTLYLYILTVSMVPFLYTCSLGYVLGFLFLFLYWFPLNSIILRVDVAVFCV